MKKMYILIIIIFIIFAGCEIPTLERLLDIPPLSCIYCDSNSKDSVKILHSNVYNTMNEFNNDDFNNCYKCQELKTAGANNINHINCQRCGKDYIIFTLGSNY